MTAFRIQAWSRGAVALAALGGMVALAAASHPAPPVATKVVLTEYRIDMPKTVDPGKQVFEIENAGKVAHGFAIRTLTDSAATVAALPEALAPGEKGSLEVMLDPGTYRIVDPIEDHTDRGMMLQLVVQAKSPSQSPTPTP